MDETPVRRAARPGTPGPMHRRLPARALRSMRSSTWTLRLLLAAAVLMTSGCAASLPRGGGTGVEVGLASYYSSDYHRRRTASGEIYDMYAMTAAHRTLPFGTRVRVTNLENGRHVVVRINDRGPFVRDRVIDVSWAAAGKLGMRKKGTARVRIEPR
jgi:peptidoglycan lytic transglycosylase